MRLVHKSKVFDEEFLQWKARNYAAPSPTYIKRAVLQREGIPNAAWVETGTYLGETAKFLSAFSKHVYTIEPEPKLALNAKNSLAKQSNITVIQGTSEDEFPKLLSTINEPSVNFWLDGHFSSGITFQGKQDTPIIEELRCIAEYRNRFKNITVLVDDLRCFGSSNPEYKCYPDLNHLINWANELKLKWHIEHDIFVAKSDAS